MKLLTYRLYDRNSRRVSKDSIGKAYSFEIYYDGKLIDSLEFSNVRSKVEKEIELTIYLQALKEEIEIQLQSKREKAKIKREREKEKQLIKKQKQEQRELARLLKKDLQDILKEEEGVRTSKELKAVLKEEYVDPEEQKRLEEEKRKIKEQKKLRLNIEGRIRLFVQENLANKYQFWTEKKREDFVKILERVYGKETKKLKDRADETKFKKFITKVIKILDSYDSRVPPTEGQIMRSILKRVDFENELMDQDKFEEGQLPEQIKYKFLEEKFKFYFSKTTRKNTLTKQYIYKFDPQLDVSTSSVDGYIIDDTLNEVKNIIIKEINKLYEQGDLKIGKSFQVRLLIPQYDQQDSIVYEYTGGNGTPMDKRGYGISVPSMRFSFKNLEKTFDKDHGLMKLTKDRLRSYFARNSHIIHSQYISGFMIIVEA